MIRLVVVNDDGFIARLADRPDGVYGRIVELDGCITKRPGFSYDEYLKRLKNNELARKVKIADMTHNSDLSRLKAPTEKDYERAAKYKEKIKYLTD